LKTKLYVCCSYSETVIINILKSVARIRLVKTENFACASDLQNVEISDSVAVTCSFELCQ
jgi:hypothetical protein